MSMKKQLLLAALAITALAGCTDDAYVGNDQGLQGANGGAISFNMNTPAVTRADQTGEDAATALGNQFIVYGEKGAITNVAPTTGNLVFPNYQVNYSSNTAYTSTSNTKDWEYVGATHTSGYQTYITTKARADADPVAASNVAQTIKYWDYGAANYVFTAVSAKDEDITAGRVRIQKNEYGATEYDKGYTITLKKTGADEPYTYPDLSKLFFADRKVIVQSTNSDRNAPNAYGGNVTLKFRNLLSHVRVGMFETVPGYSVKIDKFHYKNDGTPANFAAMTEEGHTANSTTAFVANASNLGTSNEATLTVTYQGVGATENQPTVAISGATAATALTLGTNIPGTALGETATTALFDQDEANAYTPFFPQETNSVPLKLKVDYTLTAPVTGEVITVEGATAEIPAQYLQWKPNYKYTYLFKISDNTNGHTGATGPEGLYPITFDAIEVVAEDGLVEYITTVSEPSITTFGVSGGKYVTGSNEYPSGTVVYAVVEDGSSLATLSSSNMSLYTVTTDDEDHFPITEASVAEALIEKPAMTKAEVDNAKIDPVASSFTGYQKTAPAEDGTTKTLDADNNKVAYFTTASSTKYALVYEKTAATYVCGTAVTADDESDFDTKAAAAPGGKLYTTAQCTTEATRAAGTFYEANGKTYATAELFAAAGTLYTNPACTTIAGSYTNSSTIYYKPISVANKGVYAVKIVTCP